MSQPMNERLVPGEVSVRGENLLYVDEYGVPRRVTGIVDPAGAQSSAAADRNSGWVSALLAIAGILLAITAVWTFYQF